MWINYVYLLLIVAEVIQLVLPSPDHVPCVQLLPDPLQFCFIRSIGLHYLINCCINQFLTNQCSFLRRWESSVFLQEILSYLKRLSRIWGKLQCSFLGRSRSLPFLQSSLVEFNKKISALQVSLWFPSIMFGGPPYPLHQVQSSL